MTPNVLDRAAELIEDRGWCRRWFEDDEGRLCLLGALRRAGSWLDDSAHTALIIESGRRYGLALDLGQFNNQILRSKAEAVALLRAAARRLDGADEERHGGT